MTDTTIAVYKEYTDKLAEIKAANLAVKFDYESPAGNKAARSHVYKLRQTKTAIEETRVAAKKDALEYGRKVDAQAKALMTELDEMIEVHAQPIRLIEQREATRIANIKNNIERFKIVGAESVLTKSAAEIEKIFSELSGAAIDESYGEFKIEAETAKANALNFLQKAHAEAKQREEERAMLQKLQDENAARHKKEFEERIRREAAEKATFEAEQKAQAERDALANELAAAIKREKDLKDQAEQAAAAERKRIKDEADRQAAEDAKRAANEAHRKAIHASIILFLDGYGVGNNAAQAIVSDIDAGKLPALKIIY